MSHDIFLSYRRTDREFAAQLVRELEKRGLTVWYDADIEGGQDWRDEIVNALEASAMLVILFSENCNESRQLKKELAVADSFEKPVVPVLIENCRPRGAYLYELADRNWIEAWPEPHSRIPELVELLTALAGKSPTPAAQPAPSPTLTGGLSSAAPQVGAGRSETPMVANDEIVVREQAGKASAVPSMASAYIGKKDKRLAKAARRNDILPFLWIDLLILAPLLGATFYTGVTATATDVDVVETPIFHFFTGALASVIILALYGAVVFPFRYYLRRRSVSVALNKYLISSGILLALAAVVVVLAAGFVDIVQPGMAIVGLLAVWGFLTVVAFTIYGLLAGQRALARFNANLRQI